MANVSKQHRDELLEKISKIREFIANSKADKNTRNLQQYLNEITKDIKGKKYGLVFEEHREAIDEKLDTHVPVLVEEKKLAIDNGGEQNFLIEGDNLAALKLLEKTHKGKIDVIYIDPPYNTGKNEKQDFHYDDKFVDINDTFRHSKWISFMEKRLVLAKTLLAKDGFIVISIDDNEYGPLKILCDEIFGSDLFVNTFIWQRNSSGKTEKDKYTVNTEYVLLYAKTKNYSLNDVYKPLAEATRALYKKDDKDGRGRYRLYPLQKPASPGPETSYDYVDNNGKVWKCPPKGWRIKYEKLKALENDGRLCLENETLSEKAYWNERTSEGKRIDTLWNDLSENTVGSKEVENIFGKQGVFNNPKPLDLIERCLEIKKNNFTILDFFAGSGTTGHAVLKLNNDGKKRKFILCTNNENNICHDVTYQRIKTVITGKRKNNTKYSDGLPGSLKYFRIDYVPISGKLYYEYADELLLHIRELVELENGINFSNNSKIAIILTDSEMENFVEENKKKKSIDVKKIYRGHNVLLSNAQATFLKKHNIKINVIPDYYYQELAK
jgi:adenine-specific DNA-methyltransferase